ncbi:MAG: helix-turn-helix transcriptional regulator, partial [Candidatus Omnitrophota bacterium]|nr:helix-turn-helix transcriptional regulator [Candidatus Omnitrophota bacterium]
MKKSAVILILMAFLCQNIAWGREFTLRPPLQGSLSKRTREVLSIPGFLLTGKIKLTKKQKAVLDLTAKGWRGGNIATALSIAEKTVGVHHNNIRNGLNLKGKGIDTRGAFLYHIYQNGYIISQPPNELVTKIIDLANELSPAEQKVLESAMSGKGSIKDIVAYLNKSKGTVVIQISHINRSFEDITNKNEFSDWEIDFWLAAAILFVNLEAYNEAKKTREVLNIPKIKLTASQKTVLDLTAKGWKEGDIAAELSIRNKTVNVHRDNIRNGLNLKGKGIDTRGAFLYHIYQNGYIISQPP